MKLLSDTGFGLLPRPAATRAMLSGARRMPEGGVIASAVHSGVLRSGRPDPMHPLSDNLALATDLADKGYIPVAMHPGTKLPAERAWQEWAGRPVTADSIARRWRGTRFGVAVLCRDIVVLDVDDPGLLDQVLRNCRLSDPPICRTPRGGYHVHARVPPGAALRRRIKVHGQGIDLLTGASLSILPPHTDGDGVPYEWLTEGLPAKSELPVAEVGWACERPCSHTRTALADVGLLREGQGRIKFPEAYCMRIESVQGQNGSRALVRVVSVLRDAGRSPQQIFDFIKDMWGPAMCQPEWSDTELR